jgi:hypothetical protein
MSEIIQQTSFADEFNDIKRAYGLTDLDFANALKFAMCIAEGRTKEESFKMVFCHGSEEYEKDFLKFKSGMFIRRKYVSEIINRLVMTNHLVFADKHYNALNELYNIGFSGVSERNRVDALKAFIEATRRPDTKIDVGVSLSIGTEMIEKLDKQLTLLANSAKMVTQGGEIVDVSVEEVKEDDNKL